MVCRSVGLRRPRLFVWWFDAMSIGVINTFFSSFSRLAWACTHVDSCRVHRAERGQASACFVFADVPLAKGSHEAKPRFTSWWWEWHSHIAQKWAYMLGKSFWPFALIHVCLSFSTISIFFKYSFGHWSFSCAFDGRETERQVRQEFYLSRNNRDFCLAMQYLISMHSKLCSKNCENMKTGAIIF